MKLKLPRRVFALSILVAVLCSSVHFGKVQAQRRRQPQQRSVICGNPNVRCSGVENFRPFDLPFRLPERAVIYETQPFYAVILQSVRMRDYDDCNSFVPEEERLKAQALFPNNKVFTSRCGEPGDVYYTNTSDKTQFMAVYAGATISEARRVLEMVRATNQYQGANIRRMQVGYMGT
ncbi:MAG: hypothetical protein QOH25_2661 [Acidobacteriota bacterium]|jgi:hypothetical protein|nr:hypothetical protein [Acidobacteriota bacterium]